MASALFELVSFDNTVKRTKRGTVSPQLMEFPVNPELGPFLVSSSRSVTWVAKTSKEGLIRAAVRPRPGIEAEVVAAIATMATTMQWGNVHPLTTKGVAGCVEHLRSYGFTELQMLISSETEVGHIEHEVPVVKASWMPLNAAVLVPLERSYVGMLGSVGPDKAVLVVHNASRGVAVAWNP